jgi:hypothetical protein
MSCPSFNGTGGGDFGFDGDCISEVNGTANWTITGIGQDVTVTERVDGGNGILTLHNFGNITIQEKNGVRTLVVESDNKSVTINVVNGAGQTFLRNSGFKKIVTLNGTGAVKFQGNPVIVENKNGDGIVAREN